MEATSPWLTFILALIGAFGGAEILKFITAWFRTRTATADKVRDALEREREELREERRKVEEYRQRLEQDGRLELRTARGAVNELTELVGLLRGQLKSADERIDELESELKALRGGSR